MQSKIMAAQTATTLAPVLATEGKALRGPTILMEERLGDSDRIAFVVKSTAGSGVMTATVDVWGYVADSIATWVKLGTITIAAETSPDKLSGLLVLTGMRNYTRAYGQVTAIAGTATAVELWAMASIVSNAES